MRSLTAAPPTAADRPAQLKVPGWPIIGAPAGTDMPPPPSQHGAADSQAGPHAGSQAGAQAGAHTGAGAAHGAGVEPHDRNSMNDGRRQLLPMQLLHPGAAARLATAITRHNARVMSKVSHSTQTGQAGSSHACGVAHDATQTVPHDCGAAGRRGDFFGGPPDC
jgi:hypothetical protein